jgi:hypothetical protein
MTFDVINAPLAHADCPRPETTSEFPPQPGDMWRCQCDVIWRLRHACGICDHYRQRVNHPGFHDIGHVWRRANLAERFLYRTYERRQPW